MKNRIPITLSPQDRARLEVLATVNDVSLAEAVRRAILSEYDRIQEEESRSRIESPLMLELAQLKRKIAELEPQIGGTAVRLLALVNCSRGRAEIESEIGRLVQA